MAVEISVEKALKLSRTCCVAAVVSVDRWRGEGVGRQHQVPLRRQLLVVVCVVSTLSGDLLSSD